jgi:cation-transporting ATPase E
MSDPLAGLDEAEVRDRVRRGEVNEVPKAAGQTVWQIVRANLFTPFNALLGTLFVIILVVGEPQDALFGVVLVANVVVDAPCLPPQDWRVRQAEGWAWPPLEADCTSTRARATLLGREPP